MNGARRPPDLRTGRAGGALGGSCGYLTPVLVAFAVRHLSASGPFPVWWEWLLAVAFNGCLFGAFWGLFGGWVARKLRDRRAAAWDDFRTARLGGYAGGMLGGTLSLLF